MRTVLLSASLLLAAVMPRVGAGEDARMACASYMGWYPPFATSRGNVSPTDFCVLPLTLAPGEEADSDAFRIRMHREELALLAAHGWNTVGVDGLFYDHEALSRKEKPHSIRRQVQLMEYFSAAAATLPENGIRMVPFIEFLSAYRQMGPERAAEYYIENMDLMLRRFADSPFWRRRDDRPIILVYVANYFPVEFWRRVMPAIRERGHDPYWVMELEGLDAALYGTFDAEALKPYLELFDGVYNFGCSGLLESAGFPAFARKAAAGLKAGGYVGATLWPGYLSDRPYNRNFIAHEGTAFLRGVWERTEPARPDFLHWVFNDYKEATTLGPTFGTLESRLDIAERFLHGFNDRPLPRATDGKPQATLSYRKALYSGERLDLEFLSLPARDAPERGRLLLRLSDEKNRELAVRESPELDFGTMNAFNWEQAWTADRQRTRAVKVAAEAILPDGRRIAYANLPDIAVVPPRAAADQLWYTIPLHRLASAERNVSLAVNGKGENAALNEGLRMLDWRARGPGGDEAFYALARGGHALRRLAPADLGGAEDVTPGQGARSFKLFRRAPVTHLVDWQPTSMPDGDEYYQALAKYPDGSWAYSPTIWTRSSLSRDELWAQWVFAPDWEASPGRVVDRSANQFHIALPKSGGRWPFVPLRGEARAMAFNGDWVLTPPSESVPFGPLTLEAVFAPERPGDGRQFLVHQRGSQASLVLDGEGYLCAMRLPERRKHPDPEVVVRSRRPLAAGRWVQAVVTYDGRELALWLNGEREGSAPCVGTRSSEGFAIGGLSGPADAVSGKGAGRFHGQLLRITVLGRPWSGREIADSRRRLELLPFWKTPIGKNVK